MSKQLAVIALGGNALIEGNDYSLSLQEKRAQAAVKGLLSLAQKYNLIITHGNGPQVGNLVLRSQLAEGKAYTVPLDYCVAQSQGEIGYLLVKAVEKILKKEAITVLTRVLVSPADRAFSHPTKPIGDFYSTPREEWKQKHLPFINDAGRGYRRVVASPLPLKINEAEAILTLAKKGKIVIAVGGGGIPVSSLGGIEAVIDKDRASALLACQVKAKLFIIVTAVDGVYLNYGKLTQKKMHIMTTKDCRKYLAEGQFPGGSMGPKIESALSFLSNGGRKVIITDPKHIHTALKGKTGTIIIGDNDDQKI